MFRRQVLPVAIAAMLVVVAVVAGACRSTQPGSGTPASETQPASGSDTASVPSVPTVPTVPSVPTVPLGSPAPSSTPRPRPETSSAGEPRRALLSIPAIGLEGLAVVPYRGRTDDAPGTEIQNRGIAASPYGPRGGVGPGGVGNYQVTAHRTSSTRAFADLPSLRRGDRVEVVVGGTRYLYEIRHTRQTSFSSERSLAEQRADVPGRPGAVATTAFLTLSTCATQEDHASGNFWADRFGNPEHRIDKIGVLVRTTEVARR